jgi:hypothetical protein
MTVFTAWELRGVVILVLLTICREVTLAFSARAEAHTRNTVYHHIIHVSHNIPNLPNIQASLPTQIVPHNLSPPTIKRRTIIRAIPSTPCCSPPYHHVTHVSPPQPSQRYLMPSSARVMSRPQGLPASVSMMSWPEHSTLCAPLASQAYSQDVPKMVALPT